LTVDRGAAAKAETAGVFSRVAPTYDTVIPFFQTFGRHLVAAASLRPGERVLDLACGRGAVLFPAALAVGEQGSVLGIDIAP
jgi:ubiquinone/menaquinone biosynthesis C-methylase UbiE